MKKVYFGLTGWMWLLWLLCLGMFVTIVAQQPPTPKPQTALQAPIVNANIPAAKINETPTISDAHRADFFKYQGQVRETQAALQAAEAKLQTAISELNTDCGDKYSPTMDPKSGDPICVPKPATPGKK